MGGDFAPEAAVRGALECVADPRCDFGVVLFGDEQRIQPFLPAGPLPEGITVVHTRETIGMGESATTALKSKRDSSIVRALEAHKAGEVHGFISAGNTGAVMAASTLILGRLPGVARPTIGTFLPSQKGWTLVIDAGANVDSKPHHLAQFGVMGAVLTELLRGVENPSVGLLNVGEEEGKGNEATIEAYKLLKNAPLRFAGNVEGRDILKGTVDVVVCDGFTGNIILKFAESIPGFLKAKFTELAQRGLVAKLSLGLLRSPMRAMMKEWDYQEHGGVPLLGVNGVSIIGHGSSSPRAIKHMILKAKEMIDRRVNERIAEAMATLPPAA
ncbi:MAG: phosphate acyltransferase PlsX [Ignavibacteriae bacterium]|nr:phosphate acyltransferase PlsX [Ignavibacteriota bacterium]